MKRHVPLLTTIMFAGATALMAQAQSPTPRSKPDQPTSAKPSTTAHEGDHAKASAADMDFAKKVAAGGEAEVQLAMLAQQKATASDVKDLASRLHTDHMKANDELKKIASQKGWTLPTEPTAEQKAKKDRLEKLSGSAFDKEFVNTMVTNHKTNIPNFEREASRGSDPDLKQWASNTLPTLKEHLEMAQKVQKSLGGSSATSSKPSSSKPGYGNNK
jgi:putative membrane protein